MSLTPGTRLGPYEVLSPIGKGGMGEVYRARDTKLDRDVAIKVLPEEFAADPERLARFEREAKLLASLNHPNIAAIHGFEESNGVNALVLELVEGPTLAERIEQGPIPVDEALAIAKQIAEALEAGHEAGVIHRDLKPANIKLKEDGTVKVLDYGLAKALEGETPAGADSELSQSPTLTRQTQVGVILGTAAYMSPEQAKGTKVDKRTDIFAFGAVLYEMLSGKKAFAGEDASEILAAIINKEPDWDAFPRGLGARLQNLLRRCLRKDRKKRLRDIGDAGNEIEEILSVPGALVASGAVEPQAPVLAWAVAAAFAVALVMSVWSPWESETPSGTVVRVSMELGASDVPLYTEMGGMLALSPDGKTLAFVGGSPGDTRLYVRALDSLEAKPLGDTEGGAFPFFSPDGEWLGFYADSKLKKVSIAGGPPVSLCDAGRPLGASWGPNGVIVFGTVESRQLQRVSAFGGVPEPITTLEATEIFHQLPNVLPGGRAVLLTVWSGSVGTTSIAVQSLVTGDRRILVDGTHPRFVLTGHIIFARANTLWAMPFDRDRLEVTGAATPLIERVYIEPDVAHVLFAVSDEGTLLYVPGVGAEVRRKLVWVDRDGTSSAVTDVLGDYETPRLSPDGKHLAVRRMDQNGQQDIWLLELFRGAMTRFTFDEGLRPLWSPDGDTVFFLGRQEGSYNIFTKRADGSGPAEQLTKGPMRVPASISSDGRTLVFRQGGDSGSPALDIGIVRLDADAEPEMILETTFNEHSAKLSPDDAWMAYVSDESGRDEVYVIPFPEGGKLQISAEGGAEPMWSRDGRELFYRNGEKMMAVDVSAGAGAPGRPTLLFEGSYDLKSGSGASNYDVAEDGRFVMIQTEERAAPTHVILVQNWFEELKRMVPTQ